MNGLKLVATADTHFPFDEDMIPSGDIFLHAGDLMLGGHLGEWNSRLQSLADLPHKQKIFVPGNHDKFVEDYPDQALPALLEAGITVVGHPLTSPYITLENGMTLRGLPYVINLRRWAFFREEDWIEEHLKREGRYDIVVSHGPPNGLLDSADRGGHIGCLAFRKYLVRTKPLIWICGHVHESYGHTFYDETNMYNVAMCDLAYEQVNKPQVIELPWEFTRNAEI